MPKPPRTASTATVRMSRFELEWSTASIRTLALWGALLVTIAGVGAYAYWQRYHGPQAPQTRAQRAVFRAQDLLLRAREVAHGGYFADTVKRAERSLEAAKAALMAGDWPQAEASGLDSQHASQEVLDYIREKEKKGPTAKFVRLNGEVEVKKREESRWVPAAAQMALEPGDLVRTKPESSAQLIFFDGVSLMLSPSSLIEVQLRGVTRDGLNRNPNVHLSVGQVDLSTPKFNVAGTSPSLSTENVEATLRMDTDLHVARDEAARSTVVAVSGSGGAEILSSAGEKAELLPREGARVEGTGEQVRTVKQRLPRTPLLVLPADLKVYHEIPTDGVQLRWQQLSEATAYHVQVSTTSLWSRFLVDKRDISGEPVLTLTGMQPGDLYWRVATIDSSGNTSPFSQHRKISVAAPGSTPDAERGDREAPRLTVLKNLVFENIVILSGLTEPGVTLTVNDERVDVEEDGNFTHFTVLYNDGPNDIAVLARDAAGNVTRRHVRVDVAVF